MVAHHVIMFSRAASRGRQNASNYSIRLREASVPAE
jgi:hopanoid C-2 methylase